MERLKLANSEEIVKNYDYSTVTKGLFKKRITQNSLTVTNKRVVLQSCSETSATRKEIPVSSAEYVEASYATQGGSFIPAIVLGALTLIFLVLYFVFDSQEGSQMTAIFMLPLAAISFIFGIICLVRYLLSLGGAVVVTIGGRRPEINLLSLGAHTAAGEKASKFLRLKVNLSVATGMVDELGAVLMEINHPSVKKVPDDENANEQQ